jgi:hypothetical protein
MRTPRTSRYRRIVRTANEQLESRFQLGIASRNLILNRTSSEDRSLDFLGIAALH